MDKTDVWFEEKILKLKTKLVIYRNVLGCKIYLWIIRI